MPVGDMESLIMFRYLRVEVLDSATTREDPREKLRALRAEFAKKAEDQAAAQARSLVGPA